MKREFILQAKPYSINSFHYKDGRTIKKEAREWMGEIFCQLEDSRIQEILKDLRESFDKEANYYSVCFTFYYPEKIFYKKKGGLSRRAFDLTNVEKTLLDVLMLPKYFDQSVPKGAKNLNIDDAYVADVLSYKRPSKDENHYIEVSFSIKSLDDFCSN